MHLQKTQTTSLALFCKVVDNYGDIGICWRLAKQLEQEHGIAVTLWVDDLLSFQRICPEIAIDCDTQKIAHVTVRHWRDQDAQFAVDEIADIVIEFFACDIPPAYIGAMAARTPRPVWLNLEGLTAEEWVEGCHTLPSPHPRLSLTKHFFFPGFTNKTGGLLLETRLEQQRQAFQSDRAAITDFLMQLGVTASEMASLKVSLFCYPQAPVSDVFEIWKSSGTAITCLVPEGVASHAVETFLGREAIAGATATRAALTVRVLPFMPQPDYDKLLWACDLNFVRGEDSFVRAQWAGRPFIWHIYPQDENLHHVKLKAFLQRYASELASVLSFSLAWNGATEHAVDWFAIWASLLTDRQKITDRSAAWQAELLANGDLSSNLLKFAGALR
ncbi:elongation factor P maturation arginine rhamnosyltransferase EarP [Undibacterium sp. Jales W-56]|uniref:elongation factor P maturation arginine rhamnosyltransferase EarP n=1 Tax=Undibacterium sp. Jales W-56 TaxID=2897325 RepID=UPI0021CE8C81|nr:elongation factor P maturation arginine rhamnosyltransferase EarP [Undibacterium sp. Jales W-56]MCU6435846.1 elongation factor P maturation arginine rhamnosyltransferase EarP [Undibacterium sp. Jales W-56]